MLPFLETDFHPIFHFTAFSTGAHENGLGSKNEIDWKQFDLGFKGSQLSNFLNILNIFLDHFKNIKKNDFLYFFVAISSLPK